MSHLVGDVDFLTPKLHLPINKEIIKPRDDNYIVTICDIGRGQFISDAYKGDLTKVNACLLQDLRAKNRALLEDKLKLIIKQHETDNMPPYNIYKFAKPFLLDVDLTQEEELISRTELYETCRLDDTGMKYALLFYCVICGTEYISTADVGELLSLAKIIVNIQIDYLTILNKLDEGTLIDMNHLWSFSINNSKKKLEELFIAKPIPQPNKTYLKKSISRRLRETNPALVPNESIFICQVCGLRTEDINFFFIHFILSDSDGVYTYKCKQCGYIKFENTCALFYHAIIDMFLHTYSEFCFVCGQSFSSIYLHLRQQKPADVAKPYECDPCHFRSNNQCDIKLHLHNHKKTTFVCILCSGVTFDLLGSRSHSLSCLDRYVKESFVCSKCDYLCGTMQELENHLIKKHFSQFIICPLCPYGFKEFLDIQNHLTFFHKKKPMTGFESRVFKYCSVCKFFLDDFGTNAEHARHHSLESRFKSFFFSCYCGFCSSCKRHFRSHWATCPSRKHRKTCVSASLTAPKKDPSAQNSSQNNINPLCGKIVVRSVESINRDLLAQSGQKTLDCD